MDLESQRVSFGAAAGTYDAHRPGWPEATADWLTGAPNRDTFGHEVLPLEVLDLGAGTGKLTAALVAAGHRVTAADPSSGMLTELRARLPRVPTVEAVAEELPFHDQAFDVVTVAQAWHWFDAESAAAECARVLRPGGLLSVGWHLRDTDVEWVAELDRLTGDLVYADRTSVRERPTLHLPPPFGTIERATFEYDLELTPAGLARIASTWSYVALREDRDQVLADVEALGRRVAGSAETLTLPHTTICHRARREA
jgi:ubiquinone/menaquinone biosynthesis C-methylase UbiE